MTAAISVEDKTVKATIKFNEATTPTGAATETPVSIMLAVPAQSQADSFINTENRSQGDRLMAYSKEYSKYFAWELDANKDWQKVTNVSMVSDSTPEASDHTLKAGEAVWFTTTNSAPVLLLVSYGTKETAVELEAGTVDEQKWNLVAPTTGAEKLVKSLETQVGENDIVLVPQTSGAPMNVRKSGGKFVYDGYKEVGGKKIPAEVEVDDESIPAGTGFWYISGGTESINL